MAHSSRPERADQADEQFEDFLWDIDVTARRPRVDAVTPMRPVPPVATTPAPAPASASASASASDDDVPVHTRPRYRSAQPSAPAPSTGTGRGRFFRPELEPGWHRIVGNPYLQLVAGTLLAAATAYLVVVALTR
ncbi:hypothetical protein ACEXQD_01185 [Herbiconiux sp. P15]|uniref:hypothetical protein n=1 Tax=Herbiconiux liukaitaii TaxID=3342799 RepID=UPI0035B7A8E9